MVPDVHVLGVLVGHAVRSHRYEYLTALVKVMMQLNTKPDATMIEKMDMAAFRSTKVREREREGWVGEGERGGWVGEGERERGGWVGEGERERGGWVRERGGWVGEGERERWVGG